MLKFEWNPTKSSQNRSKHGVSFEEARSVFYDENAAQFYDVGHSDGEERFIMLGLSDYFRMLVVVHCERDSGETIRIISARKATRREQGYYLEQND